MHDIGKIHIPEGVLNKIGKFTPEEYQQLLDETQGIVTKAKIRQAIGSYGNVLKIGAFIIAGYFIGRTIYNFYKGRKE